VRKPVKLRFRRGKLAGAAHLTTRWGAIKETFSVNSFRARRREAPKQADEGLLVFLCRGNRTRLELFSQLAWTLPSDHLCSE